MIRLKSSLRFRGAALGLAVIPALVLAGCGGGGSISLAKLAENQEAYVGKQVATSGQVEVERNSNGSRYYVLADPARDLVVLEPTQEARPFAGHSVSVRGTFTLAPHVGRVIRITRIELER